MLLPSLSVMVGEASRATNFAQKPALRSFNEVERSNIIIRGDRINLPVSRRGDDVSVQRSFFPHEAKRSETSEGCPTGFITNLNSRLRSRYQVPEHPSHQNGWYRFDDLPSPRNALGARKALAGEIRFAVLEYHYDGGWVQTNDLYNPKKEMCNRPEY